ncbi:efflux RND transporter periplasmic adaptor subunit [Paracoccus aerius]
MSEAQGTVERAESGLEQARRAVQDTVLRAPEDGVVTSRDMAPGQVVGAAQVVLTLAALDGLEAVFDAPDHPRLHSAMGQAVRLETIDIDRPEMQGTVTEISPSWIPRRARSPCASRSPTCPPIPPCWVRRCGVMWTCRSIGASRCPGRR